MTLMKKTMFLMMIMKKMILEKMVKKKKKVILKLQLANQFLEELQQVHQVPMKVKKMRKMRRMMMNKNKQTNKSDIYPICFCFWSSFFFWKKELRKIILFLLFSFVHSHIETFLLFLFLLDVVIVVYFFLCAGCAYFFFPVCDCNGFAQIIHSFFSRQQYRDKQKMKTK